MTKQVLAIKEIPSAHISVCCKTCQHTYAQNRVVVVQGDVAVWPPVTSICIYVCVRNDKVNEFSSGM